LVVADSLPYCIIGAGASGLAAAKNLKALGIPFEALEREDDVGGLWYYGSGASGVYRSAHLISSKPLSAYPDFPMPDEYPDYPSHAQVLAYLRAYAAHFGLYEHISFGVTAERVERAEDGSWHVALERAGRRETRRYRGLVIANGHHREPKYPNFPGTFLGETLHSHDYKTPDVLVGKRVLVVGGGNSGCDIAVEAAQHAAKVFHSLRRGYHLVPKYVFGVPTDQVNERALKLRLPLAARRALSGLLLRLARGDPARFGLPRPDHKLFEAHPVINSQLLYALGHGDITPKPNVAELRGNRVRFEDGSEEALDLIVYATGYTLSFPFLDEAHLDWQGGPRLYLHLFHPQYDNLFVAGLIQPDSGQFWLVDEQMRLVARFIRAQRENPAGAARVRRLKAAPSGDLRGGVKHLATERHFLEVEHASYSRRLRALGRALQPREDAS
jgi:hypothetical protein